MNGKKVVEVLLNNYARNCFQLVNIVRLKQMIYQESI